MAAADFARAGEFGIAMTWGGAYVGVHGGFGLDRMTRTATNSVTGAANDNGTDLSGGVFGVQGGVNVLIDPRVLVGFEADYSAAAISGSSVTANRYRFDDQTKGLASYRARFGYLIVPNMLVYMTGGLAWQTMTTTRTQLATTTNLATPGTVEDMSHSSWGGAFGFGVEYAFGPVWTVKAEYIYRQFRSSVLSPLSFTNAQTDSHLHVLQIGLNYRLF